MQIEAFGKVGIVAACKHAVDEFFPERGHVAVGFPGGHGAAELVGFAGREAGSDHGQLDDLLLKNGYSQGAFEHVADGVVGIIHRFQSVFSAQVRMYHVALNGTGANDGNFDHQVVPGFGFQSGQHVDLGAGFHLEYADAVAFLQHVVGGPVFLGNVLHAKGQAFLLADQLQSFANGREHA